MADLNAANSPHRTWLFVYGTLKSGMSNHFRLQGQPFIRQARTLPRYRLLRIRWYPGLIDCPESGRSIEGEIYAVDEATLRQLDEFEGVPVLFERRPVLLEDETHSVEAYFYRGDPSGKQDVGSIWSEDSGSIEKLRLIGDSNSVGDSS
ncbi:MAG: gamma-glutamylcyclotransferase [Gemmataceae bacterium]|nr:gamma-glutamylcyclotransferase [Gemmataceae bacterium]